MGRRRKKKRTGGTAEPETVAKAPHSFVIKRGVLGRITTQLMTDFRRLLEPFTASKLKVRKQNVVRDFLSVAGYLNVTHLIVFTKTKKCGYLKLSRLPRGPTITYKIVNFTLTKDILSSQKKPQVHSGLFKSAPLLVMNSFSNEDELKNSLMTSMWRNLFPSINIQTVKLNTIRRCVLLNINQDNNLIDFRHYAIKVKPIGVARPIRKLLSSKKIPDLGQFNDIHEMMALDGGVTESEGEGDEVDESRQVTLPQEVSSRGNMRNEKSTIRLVELGPRLTLDLFKIEEGLMSGEILYHSLVKKTKEEAKVQRKRREEKTALKLLRKKQQEENVKRKLASKKKRGKYKRNRSGERVENVESIESA